MSEEKKDILSRVQDLDKVTKVQINLDGRPEEYEDTYTPAQRDCLMELHSTSNPYMVADFLSRLATVLAMSTNAAETKLSGKNSNTEWRFSYELTKKGRREILR